MVAIARGFPASLTTGQDYVAGAYYGASIIGSVATAISTGTNANFITMVPFWCRYPHTFTGIAVKNSASINTNKFHLGIYSASNGQPSSLVVDGGEVTIADTNTATLRTTTISQALSGDTLYFLACLLNTNSMSMFCYNDSRIDWVNELGGYEAGVNFSANAAISAYRYSYAYAALPSSITQSSLGGESVNAPAIWLKG